MKRIACFMVSALAITSPALGQALIGSWKFEGAVSPSPGVYFITSSIGDSREGSYSAIDFYCDKGKYSFNLMPAPDPRTGRNELPDGLWTVQVFINNEPGGALSGKSAMGMISTPVPKETISALSSIRPRSPSADVFTAMIEKIDGGGIQRSINYPATRFRAAMNILAEACRTDR